MKYSQSLRPRIVPSSPAIGQESSHPVRNPTATIPSVPNSHAQMSLAVGKVGRLKLTPYHGCGISAANNSVSSSAQTSENATNSSLFSRWGRSGVVESSLRWFASVRMDRNRLRNERMAWVHHALCPPLISRRSGYTNPSWAPKGDLPSKHPIRTIIRAPTRFPYHGTSRSSAGTAMASNAVSIVCSTPLLRLADDRPLNHVGPDHMNLGGDPDQCLDVVGDFAADGLA